jgi:hypothetical protein
VSAARDQVLDPTTKSTVAAHAATASVLRVMSQEMMRLGFADGGEVDQDWQLRRLVWLKVLARIDQKRDPRVGVVAAAIGRAPEPTRARLSSLLGCSTWLPGLTPWQRRWRRR